MKNSINNLQSVLQPKNNIKQENTFHHVCWLAIISVSMTFLIVMMPKDIWAYLWKNVRSQGMFLYLGLIFTFIALSFIWAAGQTFDVWIFKYLNVRGIRPLWLDRTMLCFTQIGNNVFALILAVIFYY